LADTIAAAEKSSSNELRAMTGERIMLIVALPNNVDLIYS
jgi:hypothetical protein